MNSVSTYTVGPEDEVYALNERLGFDDDGEIDCENVAKLPGIYLVINYS
jgi:hypothetical protein